VEGTLVVMTGEATSAGALLAEGRA